MNTKSQEISDQIRNINGMLHYAHDGSKYHKELLQEKDNLITELSNSL